MISSSMPVCLGYRESLSSLERFHLKKKKCEKVQGCPASASLTNVMPTWGFRPSSTAKQNNDKQKRVREGGREGAKNG